jgi:hypothetical protein
MNSGICTLAAVPVRSEPSSKSEMTNMILFGETFSFNETYGEWVNITGDYDNYTGWLNVKYITPLELKPADSVTLRQFPLAGCAAPDGTPLLLLPGSTLPDYQDNTFRINGKQYRIALQENAVSDAITFAKMYINAPYLWGGRSLFGIDCSGLTQVVYKMCGVKIPRDASQQALAGEDVSFRSAVKPGDLAFFDNEEGRITHVGLMIDSDTIIHASGKVRIDKMDDYGIWNGDTKQHSHKLRIIKRL